MRRDLVGTLRRLLDVTGNLLRCRALFFHRRSDRCRDLGRFLDGAADLLDRTPRIPCFGSGNIVRGSLVRFSDAKEV